MEIHPIRGPVLTWREFFVHLSIITIGILIALSLEGLVEWMHHRTLVREARENLAIEIAHNKKAIEVALPRLQKSQQQLTHIIEVMQKLESNPKTSLSGELGWSLTFDALYSTSWNTANRSGAVAYMSYDEVAKYTDLYDGQAEFTRMRDQAIQSLVELGGLMPTILAENKKRVPERNFEEIEQAANRGLTTERTLEAIARELQTDYAKLDSHI